MLRALGCATLIAATVLGAGPIAAAGSDDPPPVKLVPGTGYTSREVRVHPKDPGHEGNKARGGSAERVTEAPTRRKCTSKGETVPCTNVAGTWSAALGCWVRRYSPQPPKDYPGWKGHSDGAIYLCTPPDGTGESMYDFWAPNTGAVGAPQVVDPVDLAEEAVKAMRLRAVDIGITPPAGPDTYTLIGIPTWMWVDEPSPVTWGPITRSASAGAVTVTATAHVSDVVWDMGDGSKVSCGRGTPYSAGHGADPSPTCGHTYATPGRFDVSATSHWTVDWEGAGQAGTITLTLTDDSSVWVRQAHGLISRQG